MTKSDKPNITVRTPWDVASEALGVLGNAAPYVIIVGIAVFAFFQYTALVDKLLNEIEAARQKARDENRDANDKLTARLDAVNQELEKSRQGQLDTLNKVLDLHKKVSDAISSSQSKMVELQQNIQNQEDELRKSQQQLESARMQLEEKIEERNAVTLELEEKKLIAEVAVHLVKVLTDSKPFTPQSPVSSLSEKYEGKSPDHIGRGADGAYYYGSYRIRGGDEIQEFIRVLGRIDPKKAEALDSAGGAEASRAGERKGSNLLI